MSGVLWLLYLADITTGLSFLTGIFGIGGSLLILAWWGAAWVDPLEKLKPPPMKLWKAVIPALIICAVLPSQNTLYAVAAVQAGDAALKTETGGKAVRALNAWLDKQIAENGSEKRP